MSFFKFKIGNNRNSKLTAEQLDQTELYVEQAKAKAELAAGIKAEIDAELANQTEQTADQQSVDQQTTDQQNKTAIVAKLNKQLYASYTHIDEPAVEPRIECVGEFNASQDQVKPKQPGEQDATASVPASATAVPTAMSATAAANAASAVTKAANTANNVSNSNSINVDSANANTEQAAFVSEYNAIISEIDALFAQQEHEYGGESFNNPDLAKFATEMQVPPLSIKPTIPNMPSMPHRSNGANNYDNYFDAYNFDAFQEAVNEAAKLRATVSHLKALVNELEIAKVKAESKGHIAWRKLKILIKMLADERLQRRNADNRTKLAIQKAKEYAALKKAEEAKRLQVEKNAKEAIIRARGVMSYFFTNSMEQNLGKIKQQQDTLMEELAEFDKIMFYSRKAVS